MVHWVYDAGRHPAAAAFIVRHRSCADAFAHSLASLSSLVTCIFAGVAWYFAIGASVYPLALCIIMGAVWVLVTFAGEYAVSHSLAWSTYSYLVLLYGLWVAVLWTSAMCLVTVSSGKQFIEDNWYLLQNKVVIPFTTQLDQKVQYGVSSGARKRARGAQRRLSFM